MKMEPQAKFRRPSFITLLGFIFLLLSIRCKSPTEGANIGYGKSYFIQNCSTCHEKSRGFDKAPSLETLNSYDSLDLIYKIKNITIDSLHSNYLKSIKYSNKEVYSIYAYIREYFRLKY
jgi:hypothetical protein